MPLAGTETTLKNTIKANLQTNVGYGSITDSGQRALIENREFKH